MNATVSKVRLAPFLRPTQYHCVSAANGNVAVFNHLSIVHMPGKSRYPTHYVMFDVACFRYIVWHASVYSS